LDSCPTVAKNIVEGLAGVNDAELDSQAVLNLSATGTGDGHLRRDQADALGGAT
jgi:hypothetical protein